MTKLLERDIPLHLQSKKVNVARGEDILISYCGCMIRCRVDHYRDGFLLVSSDKPFRALDIIRELFMNGRITREQRAGIFFYTNEDGREAISLDPSQIQDIWYI